MLFRDFGIAIQITGIRPVVLIGAELCRIDKKADDKFRSELARPVHQRLMAGMVIAHGGHEGHCFPGLVPFAANSGKFFCFFDDLHILPDLVKTPADAGFLGPGRTPACDTGP